MKTFNWTTFTRRMAVKSSLATMYNAWTRADEIEKWFLKNAVYSDRDKKITIKTKPIEKGYTYDWSWYLYDIVESGRITEANGKDHLQFTFAGECLVDIKLSVKGDYIVVELTQSNIPTDDDSKQNIRLGCDSGWSFYLVNLKSFYENGHDLRNKDVSMKGMVNS